MKKLTCLLLLALMPSLFAMDKKLDEPIIILPLGDSITQGGRLAEEYSYRYPLFKMLTDAGVQFDFIGSMNKGLKGKFTWPDYNGIAFDTDHEGHYGWKTAKVYEKLAGWMEKYPAAPDIVLIHLGTNDQKAEDYNEAIAKPMEGMISLLREKNPNVIIFLGHLNFDSEKHIEEMQPVYEELAKELSTERSPVLTVHHYKDFNENPKADNTDTFDWAHPNPSGQKKMAQKWFDAMKPFLPIKGDACCAK